MAIDLNQHKGVPKISSIIVLLAFFMPFFLSFIIFACESPGNEAEQSDLVKLNDVLDDSLSQTEIISEEAIEDSISEEPVSKEFEDVDWNEYMASMTKNYSYVIVISTKSYDEALERAKDASDKLGYPLDLRDLHPNRETGLSVSKEVCAEICGGGVDYPQYLPRNEWGPSKYVSVEYSNGFEGYSPGYYMVIIASGEQGDPSVREALKEAQVFYKDAYAKTCGVWMGCGC